MQDQAEVKLAPSAVEQAVRPARHSVLIADRAFDRAPLRTASGEDGLAPVCPRRRGRRRKATQDGRKLRRYRRAGSSNEPSLGSVSSGD